MNVYLLEVLLNFLNTKKLSIGWKIYLEKISLRDRQEWWTTIFMTMANIIRK